MRLVDLERALLTACFAAEPTPQQLTAAGDLRGVGIYRELVRERLLREIRGALPRSSALLGKPVFEAAFARFLEREPPRTRYFREIPLAFADSALPAWQADPSLPSGAVDLVRYEAALWQVGDLEAEPDHPVHEFSFERPAAINPALRLLSLTHAVHAAKADDGSYARGEYQLCIHRETAAGRARAWTVNKTTYELLQRLRAGTVSVAESVQQMAAERGERIDARYVDGLCETLSQFIELGIVLGSR